MAGSWGQGDKSKWGPVGDTEGNGSCLISLNREFKKKVMKWF